MADVPPMIVDMSGYVAPNSDDDSDNALESASVAGHSVSPSLVGQPMSPSGQTSSSHTTTPKTRGPDSRFTKQEVKDMLRDGLVKLEEVESRSQAWSKFDKIITLDGEDTLYARCKNDSCGAILKVCDRSTTSLNKHDCKATRVEKSLTKNLLQSQLVALYDECARMCARDLCGFSIFQSEGFIKLAQHLIGIGSVVGRVDAGEALPSFEGLANHLASLTSDAREKVKWLVSSRRNIAATTTRWRDVSTQQCYISCNVHVYVNKLDGTADVIEQTLETESWNPDDKMASINVWHFVWNTLASYGIRQSTHNVTFVTEGDSGFVPAFQNCIWCPSQVFDLTISTVFEPAKMAKNNKLVPTSPLMTGQHAEQLKAIYDLEKACRNLVDHIKNSDMIWQLSTNLREDPVPSAKWRSLFALFESIDQVYDELSSLTAQRGSNESSLLKAVSLSLLQQVIAVLRLFQTAAGKLNSRNGGATLHLVVAEIEVLCGELETEQPDDLPPVKELRKALLDVLKGNICYHMLHKLAFFLDPRAKKLSIFSDEEKSAIIAEAKRRVAYEREFCERPMINNAIPSPPPSVHQQQQVKIEPSPASKRQRLYEEQQEAVLEDEVDAYLKMGLTKGEVTDTTVLPWWNRQRQMPNLQSVALSILSIPADSTPTEKVINLMAGPTANDDNDDDDNNDNHGSSSCGELSPKSVSDLLLYKSFLKNSNLGFYHVDVNSSLLVLDLKK